MADDGVDESLSKLLRGRVSDTGASKDSLGEMVCEADDSVFSSA
jgi:hypothetical protein